MGGGIVSISDLKKKPNNKNVINSLESFISLFGPGNFLEQMYDYILTNYTGCSVYKVFNMIWI